MDGTVIQTGSRTRKNVVGLDLTGLIVGSEGTLAIVAEATVRLLARPLSRSTVAAFFGAPTDAVEGLLRTLAGVGAVPGRADGSHDRARGRSDDAHGS